MADIALVGPSTSPGAPRITPAAINIAVNIALASKADALATTTAGRPTSVAPGAMVFDTTLSQPVWWNGTNWVNSSGGPA
jgi:hypothetical protein